MDKSEYNNRLVQFKKLCKTGKVKFISEEAAIRFDDYENGGLLYPYKCGACGFYHLTKKRTK